MPCCPYLYRIFNIIIAFYRVYIQERESAEIKAGSWEKRYQENLVTLRSALGVDYNESVDTMKVRTEVEEEMRCTSSVSDTTQTYTQLNVLHELFSCCTLTTSSKFDRANPANIL